MRSPCAPCVHLRRWTCVYVLCLAVAMLAVPSARAQAPHELTLARTLFDEGVELADHGDWQAAQDRFSRAYTIKPSAGIAFNWATALVHGGELVQAAELLQSVLRDETATAALKTDSKQTLATIAPRIAHLRVSVAGQVGPATELLVDGARWPRAAWGVASPMDPGDHLAVCTDEGHELSRVEVSLVEGETKTVELSARVVAAPERAHDSLAAAPASSDFKTGPERQPSETKPRFYKNWIFWTALGTVAVAATVTAIVATRHPDQPAEEALAGNTGPGVLRW